MFKKFKMWLEEKRIQRELEDSLLDRIGVEPDAPLYAVKPERIMDALENMGLAPDKIKELKAWVLHNRDGSRIKDLINQIHLNSDEDMEQPPQADLPGDPAELPPGQPQPPQNPMQQSGMQTGMQNLSRNGPQ